MGKYRKKPVVIEAIQVTENLLPRQVREFYPDAITARNGETGRMSVHIETLEGTMIAMPDDWIIKGVKGEFYPCKPDIFDATYEPAME